MLLSSHLDPDADADVFEADADADVFDDEADAVAFDDDDDAGDIINGEPLVRSLMMQNIQQCCCLQMLMLIMIMLMLIMLMLIMLMLIMLMLIMLMLLLIMIICWVAAQPNTIFYASTRATPLCVLLF